MKPMAFALALRTRPSVDRVRFPLQPVSALEVKRLPGEHEMWRNTRRGGILVSAMRLLNRCRCTGWN